MTSQEKVRIRAKWRRWLQVIGNDLGLMLTSQDIFFAIQQAFRENKSIQKPPLLYSWITSNYAARISMGIRRLVDKDKRTVSLYRLIEDVSDYPDAITRRYFVARSARGSCREEKVDDVELAHHDFDLFARKGGEMVSKRKLSKDLRRLHRDARLILRFANKWVAHHDANQRKFTVPTYAHVEKALSDIDKVCCRYAILITGAGMTTWKPELQYDWRGPLRHSWINPTRPSGGQPRISMG